MSFCSIFIKQFNTLFGMLIILITEAIKNFKEGIRESVPQYVAIICHITNIFGCSVLRCLRSENTKIIDDGIELKESIIKKADILKELDRIGSTECILIINEIYLNEIKMNEIYQKNEMKMKAGENENLNKSKLINNN